MENQSRKVRVARGHTRRCGGPPDLYMVLDRRYKYEPQHFHLFGLLDHVCQVYVQNVKSDRQIRFDGKGTFNQTAETPLSVGMPLCVHSRSRDYNLVKTLSDAYVGVDYRKLIDLEKRIEYAVLDRCSKTGYMCLPDFVNYYLNIG